MHACMRSGEALLDRDDLVGEAEVVVALPARPHSPPRDRRPDRASEDQVLLLVKVELAQVVARVGDGALGL